MLKKVRTADVTKGRIGTDNIQTIFKTIEVILSSRVDHFTGTPPLTSIVLKSFDNIGHYNTLEHHYQIGFTIMIMSSLK